MRTIIPYDFMPPEQHFKSVDELLDAVAFFQDSRKVTSDVPGFATPQDKFELLDDNDGHFILLPTSDDYAFLFRGQVKYYPTCVPSLYRTKEDGSKRDETEIFVDRMRAVEFELLLKQYPAVKYFEEQHFVVDYMGLAQHYGLNTDVMDLTCDVRVALFFAMCDYDREKDCYLSKADERNYIGYLYAFPVLGKVMGDNNVLENLFKKDLRVIGLQPFNRPGSQKGFALHMRKEEEFNGYLYSFNYTKEDSERFYKEYIVQRHVWDKDFIVERTKLIRETKVFSFDALYLTSKRYGHKRTVNQIMNLLMKKSFSFSNDVPWSLSSKEFWELNKEFESQQKGSILNQLVSRKTIKEGKEFPTADISMIGSTLMLQILRGGFPSIKGYNSGIEVILEDNPSSVGWAASMGRKQTVPDESGKITRFDDVLFMTENETDKKERRMLKEAVDKAMSPLKMRTVFVPKSTK